MGAIEDEDIRFYDDEATWLREAPTSDVGSFGSRVTASLTRVVRQGNDWVFGSEVPADVYARMRRVTTSKLASGESTETTAEWWRMEIRCLRKDLRPTPAKTEEKDEVTVTEYPWASAWLMDAPFREPNPESKASLAAAWDDTDPSAIIARVEKEKFEPFQSDKLYLTAAISDPVFALETESRNERRTGLRIALGVCAARKEAFYATRINDDLRRWIERLLQGQVMDRRSGTSLLPAGMNDAALDDLLDLSIGQALAGPVRRKDAEALRGRSVAVLARQILEQHLSRMRKLGHRRKISNSLRDRDSSHDPQLSDDAKLAALEKRLATDAEFRREVAKILLYRH
jgi:hypothetical protein